MLVSKKIVPYISVLKMPSGEEVICRVVEETTTHYVVSKPLTLGQTAQGVRFIPVLMMADPEKNVEIPKPLIVGTPASEMESQYESITTGIAIPAKSGIIL